VRGPLNVKPIFGQCTCTWEKLLLRDSTYRCIFLSLTLEEGNNNLAKHYDSSVQLFVDKFQVTMFRKRLFYFIYPVVSTGCTTWPLTLRKENKLRISRNRVLQGIGTERNECSGKLEKS
jgi:hypothetical protein